MPIRPIDLQVAIPKMSEVSRMSHLEQQKSGLQQDQQAVTGNRSNQKESSSVMQSQKDAKSQSEADARKKGRNLYSKNGQQKQKKDEQSVIEQPKSKNKIDIRI